MEEVEHRDIYRGNKERLMEELRKARNVGEEEGHMDADRALLEYIGDQEVTEAFGSMPKWYA